MEIKTKFNIGDKVVIIECYSQEVFKKCCTCDGAKTIIVKGKEFECPDCYGNGGETEYMPKKWSIFNDVNIMSGYDKVIKIEANITKKETEIRYILGHRYNQSSSCTLWSEDILFATREEALLECDRRNKEIEKSA